MVNNFRNYIASSKYFRFMIVLIVSVIMGLSNNLIYARAPINLFWPSDRPLLSDNWRGDSYQFSVSYEGSIHINGFLPDEDDLFMPILNREVNALQLYGQKQNLVAGLSGFGPCSPCGALSQMINNGIDDKVLGQYYPFGDFKVPLNLMFSARWFINTYCSLSLFLPVYSMQLNNVRFCPINEDQNNNHLVSENILNDPEIMGDLNLNSWKRTGIGDLIAEFIWMRDYAQAKPFLRNVKLQTRWGLVFPTGKEKDENRLLAYEFGNDGAWAAIGAGGLDLTFGSWIKAGVDAEFMYVFGHTKDRRIRVEENQTDLFFLSKMRAFKKSGLIEQFNLYLDIYPHWRGTYFKINYQYLNENDSRLYLDNIGVDPRIINSAESLQDWSTHSVILFFNYDFLFECFNSVFLPTVSFFYKNGFRGKRALLADTLGFRLSLNF